MKLAGVLILAVVAAVALFVQRSTRREGAAASSVEQYGYEVVREYPHDRQAFTQGLLYRDGVLYESTGMYGRSTLRKVRLETGEVLQRHDVDSRYFAEGLAEWNGRLFQLTWEANIGFVYDMTFRQVASFSYPGEGWGLTHDGSRLVMSDGSASLRLLDSETQQQTGLLNVRDGDQPVADLNELEFVRGSIYANVWQTDRIAIISPDTGRVTGWINLAGLLSESEKTGTDVLNGIAYDAQGDRLFVTGKLWPKLFEIRLRPARSPG